MLYYNDIFNSNKTYIACTVKQLAAKLTSECKTFTQKKYWKENFIGHPTI